MIYAQWGDSARALESLDRATRLHDPWLQYLRVFELFDPLRKEPRFQAIERELKIPRLTNRLVLAGQPSPYYGG
jgi:hypothetical protein